MILNLKKPKGLTSHDVVNRVRRITHERRVGHGGTLDPLAEGVLIVGVGRESTKKLHGILKNTDKKYEAIIELGKTSSTDDSEGELVDVPHDKILTLVEVKKALIKFTGKIEQTPPIYSAIKINGKKAYKLARKGIGVVMNRRSVEIKKIELLDFKYPLLKIRVLVSSGAYIRSLARDIGGSLETGGYLRELVRTRVGDFHLDQSLSLDDLANEYKIGNTSE